MNKPYFSDSIKECDDDFFKFETLGEFKFYLSCGANVGFEYKGVEYGIEAVFGLDGKKKNDCYCI